VGRASSRSSGSGEVALPPAGIGDHEYQDGYVRQDAGTAVTADTWYWGYNNASQVTGQNRLSFHNNLSARSSSSSTTVDSSSSLDRHASWSDDLENGGVYGSIETPSLYSRNAGSWKFGGSLLGSYSFTNDDSSNERDGIFSATQRSSTRTSARTTSGLLTDTYDTTGVIIPSAPYQGTYAGPGAIIPNVPLDRSITGGTGSATSSHGSSAQTATFFSRTRESLDVDLHSISLGPRFSAETGPFRMSLDVGAALNVADWEATREETLYVSRNGGKARRLKSWKEQASDNDVSIGFYIEGAVEFMLSKHWSIFANGRYDWADEVSGSVGPSKFSVDLGGWSAAGGLTFRY
jgi:hypothetical protein